MNQDTILNAIIIALLAFIIIRGIVAEFKLTKCRRELEDARKHLGSAAQRQLERRAARSAGSVKGWQTRREKQLGMMLPITEQDGGPTYAK
jgi:hypothetical protein